MYTEFEIATVLKQVKSLPDDFPYGMKLSSQQLEQIRTRVELQAWVREMRTIAERARTTEIPVLHFRSLVQFERTGSRKEYEDVYRERRLRLQALTAVSLLDETEDYIATLEDLLWETCNEYTWCMNAHWPIWRNLDQDPQVPLPRYIDLGAAMLAYWLAESIYVLRGRLHPLVEQRVRTEIADRVIHSWLNAPVPYLWETSRMNWASVCSGGIGMAALLLSDGKERDNELLGEVIPRVIRAMNSYLLGFTDDGGCAEGIGYWQYGFGYYAGFASMLSQYTSGRINLLQGEQITAIAEFPVNCALSAGHFVNYSDAPQQAELNPGLFSLLHRHLKQKLPELNQFHKIYMSFNLASAIWFDSSVMGQPTLQGTFSLPDLQWVVDRRIAGNTAFGFSAKGGHNDEPHNHNDLGHFLIHVNGENLLVDLGSPVYAKGYFSAKRYDHCHASSLGHSVPVINGSLQSAGKPHKATLLGLDRNSRGVRLDMELSKAYDVPGLSGFSRSFDWNTDRHLGLAQLTLTDEFDFASVGANVEEAFVSLQQPTLSPGKAVWQGRSGRVTLEYDAVRLQTRMEYVQTDIPGHAGPMYRLVLALSPCQYKERLQFRFLAEPM